MSLIDADTGEVVDSSPSATARPWAIVERLAGPESGTVRSRLSQLEHTGLAVKVGTALVKIVADDVAVSLRRATAQVQRNERRTADDGPPPQRPAPSYSEEPF